MATAFEDRVIIRHLIDGRSPANAPETTTILVADDSEGSTFRYRVGRIRPGCNSDRPFDVETFGSPEAAEQYAHELAEWAKGEYQVETEERRETRAQALRALVSTWHRDDPARQAVEAMAGAIEEGIERNIVDALESFSPVPARRRTEDVHRGRRQAQHAG